MALLYPFPPAPALRSPPTGQLHGPRQQQQHHHTCRPSGRLVRRGGGARRSGRQSSGRNSSWALHARRSSARLLRAADGRIQSGHRAGQAAREVRRAAARPHRSGRRARRLPSYYCAVHSAAGGGSGGRLRCGAGRNGADPVAAGEIKQMTETMNLCAVRNFCGLR